MIVEITLTVTQADATTFDLYSNVDNYTTPFETNVSATDLQLGYTTSLVPDYTVAIRVQSVSPACVNYIDLVLTTTTTTTSSTTTSTTTLAVVDCNSTTTSGGVGVTEFIIPLSPAGGSVIMDFDASGVPDKLEILHNNIKKATSGMTVANSGPFDDLYGDPLVPTNTQTAETDQFIGYSKGTIPTRDAEFLSDTGITNITSNKQQLIWWVYDSNDYTVDQFSIVRITGPAGTAWTADRVCEALTPITLTEVPVSDVRTFTQLGGATYEGAQQVVSRFTLTALSSTAGYTVVAVPGGTLVAVNDTVDHTSTLTGSTDTWDYSIDFTDAEFGDTATVKHEVISAEVDGLPEPAFLNLTFTGTSTTTTTTTTAAPPPTTITYMGESVVNAADANTACSQKTTVRGYLKTYVRGGDPSIQVGDEFSDETTAGWVALSHQGTGSFYAVEIDNTGTVITLGGICP